MSEMVERVAKAMRKQLDVDWPYAGHELLMDVARAAIEAMNAWQDIGTAKDQWIIGYTSWGQHVGKLHQHIGPCERIGDHYEFANTDFDVFPHATHWQPFPEPPALAPNA